MAVLPGEGEEGPGNVPLPGRAGMAGISGSTESEMANREEQVKDSVSAVIETMATQEGAKVGRPSERASEHLQQDH